MNKHDKVVDELQQQLRNIERTANGLAEATDQHGDKLVDTEMKIFAALLHINHAANSVRDLIARIERNAV